MTEGSRFDVQPIGWNALESLRIEAGIPRYGAELTDSVIPLEAELEHAINFEKGCLYRARDCCADEISRTPESSVTGY